MEVFFGIFLVPIVASWSSRNRIRELDLTTWVPSTTTRISESVLPEIVFLFDVGLEAK